MPNIIGTIAGVYVTIFHTAMFPLAEILIIDWLGVAPGCHATQLSITTIDLSYPSGILLLTRHNDLNISDTSQGYPIPKKGLLVVPLLSL